MPTAYSTSPSLALPDQIVGQPITHLPWVFCCCNGERFCGWVRAANDRRQVAEIAAEKRAHEETCLGGLIVVGG